MKITFASRLFFAALLAAAAGCNPPKYAAYEAVSKDYSVSVPWGWQVLTEAQEDSFAQATFIGPFDGDFYLGAPSLSVRWYKKYRPHKLADGRLELYTGADDFIKQILPQIYGPQYVLKRLDDQLSYKEGATSAIEVIPEITLKSSGLPAKAFIVVSPTPAPANMHWGVTLQAGTDKPFILRKHAYAVVPIEGGFYVLTYPATDAGYEHYKDVFAGLIGSFMPYTAGPGGQKIRVPGPR
jgi:hypothetical protein